MGCVEQSPTRRRVALAFGMMLLAVPESVTGQVVFVDAELSLGLPAKVTAAVGMDALTHLVEAYIATGYHPMCDGIALEGVNIVALSLERCVAFAADASIGSAQEHIEVRQKMLEERRRRTRSHGLELSALRQVDAGRRALQRR